MDKLVVQLTEGELREMLVNVVSSELAKQPKVEPRAEAEAPPGPLPPRFKGPVKVLPRLVSLSALAQELCLSRQTIRAMMENGMPRVGVPGTKRLLFVPEEVLSWMRANRAA